MAGQGGMIGRGYYMQTEFCRKTPGEWIQPTAWENIADYCWLLYFWKTERHDRAVCRHPQNFHYGEVMPQAEARALCDGFARRVQLEMGHLALLLAGHLGLDRAVTKEEWYSARSIAQRIPYEALEQQLARHPIGEHAAALGL